MIKIKQQPFKSTATSFKELRIKTQELLQMNSLIMKNRLVCDLLKARTVNSEPCWTECRNMSISAPHLVGNIKDVMPCYRAFNPNAADCWNKSKWEFLRGFQAIEAAGPFYPLWKLWLGIDFNSFWDLRCF